MKFEKPIAQIELFAQSDVISASATEEVTTSIHPQSNSIVHEEGLPCSGTKADEYNFENCL